MVILVKNELPAPLLEKTISYTLKGKALKQKSGRLTHFDSPTGLYNRSISNKLIKPTIEQITLLKQKFALFTLDLDKFKLINDHYSHPAGDLLLTKVTRQLKNASRSSGVIARLDGDEFSMILKNAKDETGFLSLIQHITPYSSAAF